MGHLFGPLHTHRLTYRNCHSTVQYSTVQYSTVQYSTVQYSTEQYLSPGGGAAPASCSRRRSRRSRSRRPRCCRPAASCAGACGGSWTWTNQSSVSPDQSQLTWRPAGPCAASRSSARAPGRCGPAAQPAIHVTLTIKN